MTDITELPPSFGIDLPFFAWSATTFAVRFLLYCGKVATLLEKTSRQPLTAVIHRIRPYFKKGRASTYGAGRVAGETSLTEMPDPSSFDLLVGVDDMVDGGRTQARFTEYYQGMDVRTEFIAFLRKAHPDPIAVPTWHAYGAPDKWVAGYGADDERIGPDANRYLRLIALARDLT